MGADAKNPQVSRILIVDDHPLFRQGLREMILREPEWQVCGEASDAVEAMRLLEETKPDLVIVDISLGATNGIELIQDIGAKNGELPILVVSMHDESLYSERALRAGAMGYVMKHELPRTVKAAIQTVLAGEMYLSHKMATSMVAKLMRGDGEQAKQTPSEILSERELEVFRLLGQGKGTRQVAEELDVTIATINSFRARIKEKLHLKNSTELLFLASNWAKEQAEHKLPGGF